MRTPSIFACLMLALFSVSALAATDVPVPTSCAPQVNQKLSDLIASGSHQNEDNVMVCGIASAKTTVQSGGPHGSHHVITIGVVLPGGRKVSVQVVVNDALDGVVIAQPGNPVFAYGQGYLTHGKWVAGIHDVHCSTHAGADNGWVVVNGIKSPKSCPSK